MLLYVLTIRIIRQSIEIPSVKILGVVFDLYLPSEQMLIPLKLLIQLVHILFVGQDHLLGLILALCFPGFHSRHFILELEMLLA